jgi:hypothetical protein
MCGAELDLIHLREQKKEFSYAWVDEFVTLPSRVINTQVS